MIYIAGLTPQELRKAAAIQEKIQNLQKELQQLFGVEAEATPDKPKVRKMSAAGRAAIKAAQKARWARIKAKAEPVKKRKMSAAGRAAIKAAQKARWAKIKAEKK